MTAFVNRTRHAVFQKIIAMPSPTPSQVSISYDDRLALDWLLQRSYIELWGHKWNDALIMPTIKGKRWLEGIQK